MFVYNISEMKEFNFWRSIRRIEFLVNDLQ